LDQQKSVTALVTLSRNQLGSWLRRRGAAQR